MKNIIKYYLLLIAITVISTQSFADINEIKKECAECHEKDGNSKEKDIPRIAGLSETYFVESLTAYSDENRPAKVIKRDGKPDTNMKDIVEELKSNQIEQLAKFFAKQKYKSVQQEFDASKAKAGRKLHKKYCGKCHEDGGRAPDDDAGFLGGQHTAYLRNAFDNYQSGKRVMGKRMEKKWKSIYKKASDDGFEQLLHYYASHN